MLFSEKGVQCWIKKVQKWNFKKFDICQNIYKNRNETFEDMKLVEDSVGYVDKKEELMNYEANLLTSK